MRKAYIQPEVELISLASLDDFLEASLNGDGEWNEGNTDGTGGDDYIGGNGGQAPDWT